MPLASHSSQLTPRLALGVLASHGGTNLQAIIDSCRADAIDAEVRVVISNNSRSLALERARRASIPARHLSGSTHPDPDRLDEAIAETLQAYGVQLVALAGYMKMLGPRTLDAYRNRILNVHPALLPKFGGRGMYGERVHEAVLASGDSVTGVTVHLVDEEYDRGPIVAQTQVPVLPCDTPDTLAARVLEQEHVLYPSTIQRIATGVRSEGRGVSSEIVSEIVRSVLCGRSGTCHSPVGAPPRKIENSLSLEGEG